MGLVETVHGREHSHDRSAITSAFADCRGEQIKRVYAVRASHKLSIEINSSIIFFSVSVFIILFIIRTRVFYWQLKHS